MTNKRIDSYSDKIEKKSLRQLEKEIMKLYPSYLKSKHTETWKIELCLSHRKHIMNKNIQFTPYQIKQIELVNQKLREATEILLQKTKELDLQMNALKASGDDFLQDYYLEGELLVDWEDGNSILELEEDENSGESDYQAMAEILEEAKRMPISTFHYFDRDNVEDGETEENRYTDKMSHLNWNIEMLGVWELAHIPYICYASHCLFTHGNYSISDIIRIKKFTNKITVNWYNYLIN